MPSAASSAKSYHPASFSMNEVALVEWIKQHAATPRSRDLVLGIGDDCAIFRPRPGVDLLFKSDQAMEDVHFLRKQPAHITGQQIGRAHV